MVSKGYARGGVVRGPPSGDYVPAVLSPGCCFVSSRTSDEAVSLLKKVSGVNVIRCLGEG
jgi:hypothetical protein